MFSGSLRKINAIVLRVILNQSFYYCGERREGRKKRLFRTIIHKDKDDIDISLVNLNIGKTLKMTRLFLSRYFLCS